MSIPQTGHTASQNGHVSASDKAASEGYPFHTNGFTPGPLAADHREILEAESALSCEAIKARGYWTCDDKATLKALGFPSNIGRALIIPLFDWRGHPAGHAARPDIPFTPRTGKPSKYLRPLGAGNVLDVAPLAREHIDDPARVLIITEGAKKADAAASHGLCALNINGVDGSRGRNAKGGVTSLADWQSIALKGSKGPGRPVEGREVIVAFDSDVAEKPEVERALRKLCPFLIALGARVKVAYLESGPNGEKTGLDDFFARGGTVEDLRALARDLEPPEESRRKQKEKKSAQVLEELHRDGRPVVEVNDRQLAHVLDDLSDALATFNARTPQLFHGPAGLVKIERERDGAPALNLVTSEGLQVLAGRAAWFTASSDQGGTRHTRPPKDLCANYLASRADWRGVPAIDGLASAPFFDESGALCATPGFHTHARTWLSLPAGFKLPDTTPTHANIEAAKSLLLSELLGEVAFADQASRANALALMLLPFVRRMIPEPTPLHLFDAPTQASGKTYAATICLEPFGEVIPTTEKKDAEETRKALSSTLASGATVILIDNVRGTLGDSTLAAALTTNKFRGRLIGTGQDIIFDCSRVVWAATSNNAQLDPDAASRAVVIRLDTESENPEAREFRGDPLAKIRRERPAVIGAIVTLVRAWQEAGAPGQKQKCRSRFKKWERTMGGILDVIEVPGFLDNHSEAREAGDSEGAPWRAFAQAWHAEHGCKYLLAADLLDAAKECDDLAALLGDKDNKAERLGKLLQRKRDKVFAGLKIERLSGKSKRGVLWRVVPTGAPANPSSSKKGDVGDVGDVGSKTSRGSDFLGHWNNNAPVSEKTHLVETPGTNVANVANVTQNADSEVF